MAPRDDDITPPSYRPATLEVHAGTLRTPFGETSEALFLNSGFRYRTAEEAEARFNGEDDGYVYSRFGNPTTTMLEDRMCAIEGAEAARTTATGMAAVTASLLCFLNAGDHVVAARALFGSCRYVVEELLPRFGIGVTLVDGRDLVAWAAAVRPNTRAMFLESPTNPLLEMVDIAGVAVIARAAGAKLIVDNVFASPVLQKPLILGADIVVYSATKHIDGQGRCLGGVILSTAEFIDKYLKGFLRQTGPSLSPFNAWILLKGLETLTLRVERQTMNAARIADFLAGQTFVTRLIYPGRADHPQAELAAKQMKAGGSLVAFEVAGGKAGAFRFLNTLKLIAISNNLGDSKSLIAHPATTTHHRLTDADRIELGITPGTLRISAGLEDPTDLEEDLAFAGRGL